MFISHMRGIIEIFHPRNLQCIDILLMLKISVMADAMAA